MTSSTPETEPSQAQKAQPGELFVLSLRSVDCFQATLGDVSDVERAAISPERNMGLLLDQLQTTLTAVKLSMRDVFFVQLCIRDMSKFASMNTVYKERFATDKPASRACVQPSWGSTNGSVQLHCLASRSPRSMLHVQSISEWAPACIGPYSQASTVDGLVFLAGQIGLDPPTMKLVPLKRTPGTSVVTAQSLQTIRNLHRVLDAVSSSLLHVVRFSCYVSQWTQVAQVHACLTQYWREHSSCVDDEREDPPSIPLPLIQYIPVSVLPLQAEVEIVTVARTKSQAALSDGASQVPRSFRAEASDSTFSYELDVLTFYEVVDGEAQKSRETTGTAHSLSAPAGIFSVNETLSPTFFANVRVLKPSGEEAPPTPDRIAETLRCVRERLATMTANPSYQVGLCSCYYARELDQEETLTKLRLVSQNQTAISDERFPYLFTFELFGN